MHTSPSSHLTPRARRWLSLLLIVILGWVLRTHDLETRSLWEDEGWTMLLSAGPRLSEVVQTLAADQHPPLYFALLRSWRDVAGDSEFATRYLGVLIGVLAIAGVFQLGRVTFGAQTGVLAALIFALADLHIDLSQEVRHYGLLAALTVWSSVFYGRWRRGPRRGDRLGYALSLILLLYTHYLGAFVVLVHGAHAALTARPWRRLADFALLIGMVGLAFAPWALVALDQNRVRWDNPLYYQNALPNSLLTYRMVRTALLGHHYAILALLLAIGLSYWRRTADARTQIGWRPAWPLVFPALWIALVVGLTVLINARREFLTVRNFVIVVPPIALLVGHGLANLERTARAMMVALVLLVGLSTVDARRQYPDWRAVTAHITAHHLPGELVLMDVWVGEFPVRYYIDRQMGPETPRISLREWRATYREFFLPKLLEALQPLRAFWLVYWGDQPMDEYGALIAEAGFQRTATFSVDHFGTPLYSYRYDRLPPQDEAQFGDLLVLRQHVAPDRAQPGGTLRVGLWWAALQPTPLDYSVSLVLRAADGSPVAAVDQALGAGGALTSGWSPGDVHFDLLTLALPGALPAGDYALGVTVYWYVDRVPLSVTGAARSTASMAILRTVTVGR